MSEAGGERPVGDISTSTVSAVFGEIAWLMTQSAEHRTAPISILETLVMPAIVLRQFRLYHGDDGRPVAVVLYAFVSSDVASRADQTELNLDLSDWRSGSEFKIIDAIAPFGKREAFEADCRQVVVDGLA